MYRAASNDNALKFWQKYWAVRSIFLILDFIVNPYLQDIPPVYALKIAIYFSLSYFQTAEIIYDKIVCVAFTEIEPYADFIIEHAALSQYFASWKGNLYNFFIEELEEFLVPN